LKTVLAGLLVLLASNAAAGEAWWNSNWRARRIYKITGTRSELPGDEVGVVEFHAGGLSLADGRDLRVLARGRKLLAVKILATGPGDLRRVCFPLVKEVNSYHLYYGNPKARATDSFSPQRGVLLASRGFKGGNVNSWRGMQGVIKGAGPSYGRGFVDRIFYGYNPFGPQTNYVNKYVAWLKIPADGEYLFATSSDDASFMFIDGKKICEWPGWHGAIAQVRPNFSGKAQLKQGLVKLEYWHVNGALTGVAVAAWKPPGAKRAVTIPAAAFAPVRRGSQQSFSLRDGELAVEIVARSAGEAFIDEQDYLVRVNFSARLGSDGKLKARSYSWDFGDGQSGTGAAPEHVYLLRGVYAVKLTVKLGKRKRQWTERLNIDQDLRRAIAGRREKLKAYLPALARHDLARTAPKALLRLARVYEKLEDVAGQLRAARALLSRGAQVSDKYYFQHLISAVHELRKEEHGAEGRAEAIKLLAAAEERFRKSPRQQSYRARVIRERGDVYYFYAADLEKAYNEYDKVVTRFRGLEDNIVRITKIRIGDIHRERGKYQEAARRYQQAEKLKLTDQGGARGDARRGALPQMAENFLRRRRYEHCERMLNVWEWEYPMEKLRGYSTLLRTELELARKNYEEVVKLASVMLKVNPRTNFAGELLMNQARAHQRSRCPDKALECLRRIVEKYPESKKAPAARKALARAAERIRRKKK
jgi:tetratricopeptide (TPR) repeat protein